MTPKALGSLARLVDLRQRRADAALGAARAALNALAAEETALRQDVADMGSGDVDPALFAMIAPREIWRDQRRAALAAAQVELAKRAESARAALARARGEAQAVAVLQARADRDRRVRAARRAEQTPPAAVTDPGGRFR